MTLLQQGTSCMNSWFT
uniref:Uncharacterized protein n=1 Tax=Rhizophora mucronata TaxID=61149 RepID=A0A2P2QXM9_RHIMU